MNVVFIHQNFPGQFRHIAGALASEPGNQVVAICQRHAPGLKPVRAIVYGSRRKPTPGIHPYLASTEKGVINGQGVAAALRKLKDEGFRPDLIAGHAAWGELLYVKEVFPDTPLIGFFEFFYRTEGADVGFDPEYPLPADASQLVRTRNALHLLSLEAADLGVAPTQWQRSTFPREFLPKIRLIHEGVNTTAAAPDPGAVVRLPGGRTLSRKDEVITYVARNLEPYRGFHILMRAAELILARRPNAQILIVGGEDVSYSVPLRGGRTFREKLEAEVRIDPARVHFLGRIAYEQYLKVLQVSSVHLYLTVPFVLSWSMLEAMSAECLVIGSDTAPVREVIRNGENGLLVDFFSPRAFADAVDRVLADPGGMRALRAAARRTIVERYTIEQGLKAYRALFSETLGSKPARWGVT